MGCAASRKHNSWARSQTGEQSWVMGKGVGVGDTKKEEGGGVRRDFWLRWLITWDQRLPRNSKPSQVRRKLFAAMFPSKAGCVGEALTSVEGLCSWAARVNRHLLKELQTPPPCLFPASLAHPSGASCRVLSQSSAVDINAFRLQHQAWNFSYGAEAGDREFKASLRSLVRPCLKIKAGTSKWSWEYRRLAQWECAVQSPAENKSKHKNQKGNLLKVWTKHLLFCSIKQTWMLLTKKY